MKRLFTLVFLALTFQLVSAQSWNMNIFSKTDTTNLASGTHTIIGDAARHEIKEEFYTVMTSHDSMLVGIKRVELNVIPGTFEYFCWQVCYTPRAAGSEPVWHAEDSLLVHKNDTLINFSVYYQPDMNLGKACYRYVFFPETLPSDSTFIDICFDMLTIGVNETDFPFVEVFPNPANESVRITIPDSYSHTGVSARLMDYQGRMILNRRLDAVTSVLDISSYTPGVYMLQLVDEEGRTSIRKLVIE